MGMHLRKIGTIALAAVASVALLAPRAFAQDLALDPTNAPAATTAPVPSFHVDGSFLPNDQAAQQQQPTMASHHEGFGVGILGGFLYANLGNSLVDSQPLSTKTGESIGIFVGGNRPGRFGVEAEFLYNIRKATDAEAQSLSVHSFEIPVLFRGNIGSQSLKGVLVYIVAGPAVDIQFKANEGGLNIKNDYKGLNIDVMFGGGIELTRFIIQLTEDIGIRGIEAASSGVTTSIHDKTFGLLFGFRFN